jgi:hypothetical protein
LIDYAEAETEQHRLELVAEKDASEERDWRERYLPGTFGCHEALHMAWHLMSAVDAALVQHGAVVQNPQWFRLAEEASTALFNLYQEIGATHLEAEPPV